MSLIPTARGRLYVLSQGRGEPLLLLPGLGLDHQYYRLTIPLLADQCHVHAVDPLGIGQSDKPDIAYRVEDWAKDFAELIERLGLGPMHVLGSSLGGAMALALAAIRPDVVKSLIIVGGFSELDRAAVINFSLRTRLIEKLGLGEEVADYMGLWTMTREFVNSDAGLAQMRANQQIIRRNSSKLYLSFVESVLAWARALPGQEAEEKFTAKLRTILAPTLVISSDNDQLIPTSCSEIIAREMPNGHLKIMPGAGHIPMIERPKEAAKIVVDFIASLHSSQNYKSA